MSSITYRVTEGRLSDSASEWNDLSAPNYKIVILLRNVLFQELHERFFFV